MEVAVLVDDAPWKEVKVERTTNVLSFEAAPLKRCNTDLKSEERADGSAVAGVFIPKRVKLVRLIVQSHFRPTKLGVERHEVARVN